MFKKKLVSLLACAVVLIFSVSAFAHTPILNCYLEDENTVMCEGGFSNGASAAGVKMTVKDDQKKIITSGTLDDLGSWSFPKPEGNYEVEFDAGPGHVVVVNGADIQ